MKNFILLGKKIAAVGKELWPEVKRGVVHYGYRHSQVVLFLVDFFHILGLAHLTATCFDNGDGAWRFDYDGKTATVSRLTQGGSFDTPEVTEIMHNSDVVNDNPPFSKFRAIIHWLKEAPETHENNMYNYNNVA